MLIYIVVDIDNIPMRALRDVEVVQKFINDSIAAVGYDAVEFKGKGDTIFVVLDVDNITLAVFDNEDDAAEFTDEVAAADEYIKMELR